MRGRLSWWMLGLAPAGALVLAPWAVVGCVGAVVIEDNGVPDNVIDRTGP